jgi:7,8-dihydropterin-6-yl-methyl-4-(beta-D-ribofuranosyl)aminobenzene 5'-phosphate synthase
MLTTVLLLALAAPPVEIRVIYDNTSAREGVRSDWGFAAVVSAGGRRVLFDAGANPDLFMENLKLLDVDPASLGSVVISHRHRDHTGGLAPLRVRIPDLPIHMPDRQGAFQVAPGIWSTGVIEGPIPEQALAVETPKGLVLLVGCSHPGIVKIVEVAEKQRGVASLRLLLGGFHMLDQNAGQISTTVARLQQLEVERIMPAHCTGDLAAKMFREAFGARFEIAGAGKRIVLE